LTRALPVAFWPGSPVTVTLTRRARRGIVDEHFSRAPPDRRLHVTGGSGHRTTATTSLTVSFLPLASVTRTEILLRRPTFSDASGTRAAPSGAAMALPFTE
jgi:hypothetical protein